MSDELVRELADRAAIADVLARYCRGVDRCDAELIASAFHPDAVDEHSYTTLSGNEVGLYLVNRMLTMFTSSMHTLLQSRVVLDGDAADGETYFLAWLVHENGGRTVVDQASGRYVDRFERRAGEWRIANRIVLPEVSVRLGETEPAHLQYVSARPQRSRDDISYERLC